MVVYGVPERIEHRRPQAGDTAIVASYERQAIGQCGRSEKSITGTGLMTPMRPH